MKDAHAHAQFVEFNPERHCKSDCACLVCGQPGLHGMVYCERHKSAFKGTQKGWGQKGFYDLLYCHPDFNGRVPNGFEFKDGPRLVDSPWIASIDA